MGQGAATLDAIELNYNGEIGAKPNYRLQAEFADYDSSLRRESKTSGFEDAGYVTGYKDKSSSNPNKSGHTPNSKSSDAKTRFVMSVQQDGMYDVTPRYSTQNTGDLSIDHDRKNVLNIRVNNTKGKWQSTKVRMFLRVGINLVDIQSSAKLSLDYLNASYINSDPIYSEEVENAKVVGEPAEGDPSLIRDDAFAKYASGGKYVNGITSYDGKERNLELTEVEVKESCRYALERCR
jgi:hypothetical protein